MGFYGQPSAALGSSAACPPNLHSHQKVKQPHGPSHAEQGSVSEIEYGVSFEEVI